MNTVAVRARSARSGWKWMILAAAIAWALLIAAITYYVWRDGLNYLFRYTPESYKFFWPIRILIRIHVAFAITMIFLGPLQFWTGFRMRYLTLHKWCGRVFLMTADTLLAPLCIWACIPDSVELCTALASFSMACSGWPPRLW